MITCATTWRCVECIVVLLAAEYFSGLHIGGLTIGLYDTSRTWRSMAAFFLAIKQQTFGSSG